jgi:membrane protease YdiL (CAAX protease family)
MSDVLVAGGLGAAVAIVATAIEVGLGLRRIARAPARPPAGPLAGTLALLLAGAAVEELLFRAALLWLLVDVVHLPAAPAVAAAAALFGAPHLARGDGTRGQRASLVTAIAFGALLGTAWVVGHHPLAAVIAFHAAFNVIGGVVLGGAALDPLSPRLGPTPVWPCSQRRGPRTDRSVVVLAVPELLALAAATAPLLLVLS